MKPQIPIFIWSKVTSMTASFPCNSLSLFKPPKNEAELWTLVLPLQGHQEPFDIWFSVRPHFPLLAFPLSFCPGHMAFRPFQELQQCLGHSICLATSSSGNQKIHCLYSNETSSFKIAAAPTVPFPP